MFTSHAGSVFILYFSEIVSNRVHAVSLGTAYMLPQSGRPATATAQDDSPRQPCSHSAAVPEPNHSTLIASFAQTNDQEQRRHFHQHQSRGMRLDHHAPKHKEQQSARQKRQKRQGQIGENADERRIMP